LDADNAERLRDLAHRTRRPFKSVVNEVLRQGLGEDGVAEEQAPYRVVATPMRLRAGIDPARLAQMESELEIEMFSKSRRP
jgi:hypothetical protein